MSEHNSRLCAGIMAVAIAACLVTAGCGGDGGGGPSATASGTVRDDATVQPLAGVTVTSAGGSATSAADGSFSVQTTSGAQTVVFAAPDYVRRELSRTLSAGANNLGTIYLAPALLTGKGAASGMVYQAGTPSANATIQSGTAQASSKSDGSFGIYNVSSGQQVLTAVSADGHDSGYAAVQVTAGQTTSQVTINLSLTPPAPPIF